MDTTDDFDCHSFCDEVFYSTHGVCKASLGSPESVMRFRRRSVQACRNVNAEGTKPCGNVIIDQRSIRFQSCFQRASPAVFEDTEDILLEEQRFSSCDLDGRQAKLYRFVNLWVQCFRVQSRSPRWCRFNPAMPTVLVAPVREIDMQFG